MADNKNKKRSKAGKPKPTPRTGKPKPPAKAKTSKPKAAASRKNPATRAASAPNPARKKTVPPKPAKNKKLKSGKTATHKHPPGGGKAVPKETTPPASQHKAAKKNPRTQKAPKLEKVPLPETVRPDAASAASPPSAPKTPVRPGKAKILSRQFLEEIAAAIREAVLPATREARGREVVGMATSGDTTFELDRIAEKALMGFLKTARFPVAYYSEDAGYTTFTNNQPQNLLIVDPIDGTRAAKSGFEGCVIAVASTRVIERPCMADVDNACVMEILGNRTFFAERGKGTRITENGHARRPRLSKNTDLETVSWSMTVPARPAELIFPTVARLIDLTSLKGGFFACNSTSFSLTRLLTNQLDACVDVANRYYRDIPEVVRDQFINAGRGSILSIAPYDIAASLLIAEEAGCRVTDAYGRGLNDVLLLDTSVENHRSLVAASNAELHKKLFQFLDRRIAQFEELLLRRAARQRPAN